MKTVIKLLALALPLMSTPAYANPMLLFMAASGDGVVPFTINGYTAITSDSGEAGGPFALNDTGTENGISTGAGEVSIKAWCAATTLNLASVYLVVDGTTVATLSCDYSETKNGITLSHTVTAGTHNIRVYGSVGDIDAYFSADTFRKP